jgi:hypothetical protein
MLAEPKRIHRFVFCLESVYLSYYASFNVKKWRAQAGRTHSHVTNGGSRKMQIDDPARLPQPSKEMDNFFSFSSDQVSRPNHHETQQ